MKSIVFYLLFLLTTLHGLAAVKIDEEAFGNSLGGWKKRDRSSVDYSLSGATYRTYKPEISPTPDGGIFVSVRIDHVRGWLSSNDHATLEVTLDAKGNIASAQSNIAIQGRSISSDVILGAGQAGKALVNPDRAVQIGTELVADLSAKLLREKIVEAGRVSFPAVLRHNFNRLFQSIRVEEAVVTPPPSPEAENAAPVSAPVEPEKPEEKATTPASSGSVPLQIKPYGTPTGASLPAKG